MNWIKEIIGTKEYRQVLAHEPDDLQKILHPDVNLVYYKRPPDREIDTYIHLLMQQPFKGINTVINMQNLVTVISDQLMDVGSASLGKSRMQEDIIAMASVFFKITGAAHLRLILKIVADDACRKFHTDAYDLRLLCTYSGKGTEWVNDQFVNRKKLFYGENKDIIRDASKIRCMEPFEVAILKGEVPSRPNVKGIVHRSPPIEQDGEKRLLLRIDF